ncbi:hypothetical protein EJ05DRAFT_130940 [Pseudovirgaria hyperparasitica]|uniref:Uncharacterized protein n=1 Tax=Pseudovirgaria hyperparasitica TaxID=470096 RepID=A0A6A6W0W9_9PEZI|nr:uncharacterized protein EJ05DRAFT_130940 [Pseudovirgaria hyperparasitica]KAF2754721.1 hypothetical protein EJ05DRAFT_130940 [Pseudovirgaria hyperparasitica]
MESSDTQSPMSHSTQPSVVDTANLLPSADDEPLIIVDKLKILTQIVGSGDSVAEATDYAAAPDVKPGAIAKALVEMKYLEHAQYVYHNKGNTPPAIDWDNDHAPPPTSPRPLQTARRRAEALNLLYKTTIATPGHAVWWSKNHRDWLPLLKAFVRIAGAERNASSGVRGLTSVQMADLRTINKALSVATLVLQNADARFRSLADVQKAVLGREGDRLRGMIRGREKRKRGVDDVGDKGGTMKIGGDCGNVPVIGGHWEWAWSIYVFF